MLAHVPLFSHVNPKKVLIVGGGDGGCAREVCRHQEIEQITMVEIDQEVMEVCKEHFPYVSKALFLRDPRFKLIIGDGHSYVKNSPDESFDIVIVDSNDLKAQPQQLDSENFYKECKRVLS